MGSEMCIRDSPSPCPCPCPFALAQDGRSSAERDRLIRHSLVRHARGGCRHSGLFVLLLLRCCRDCCCSIMRPYSSVRCIAVAVETDTFRSGGRYSLRVLFYVAVEAVASIMRTFSSLHSIAVAVKTVASNVRRCSSRCCFCCC